MKDSTHRLCFFSLLLQPWKYKDTENTRCNRLSRSLYPRGYSTLFIRSYQRQLSKTLCQLQNLNGSTNVEDKTERLIPINEWRNGYYFYHGTVMPADTDYLGTVWHGGYFRWLEAGRIQALQSKGLDYSLLVKLQCGLVVISLDWKYHKPARLGDIVCVQLGFQLSGVRILISGQVYRLLNDQEEGKELCGQGNIQHAAVDMQSGQLLRQIPPILEMTLHKMILK
eukprot:jgi/Galph1/5684/GphlegSOOS_G4403.1